ncbi:hypothetical protein [Aureimonas sp. SK2]|uniref:hypothetical protein n=1 Tax=Aureimonas sp. SK2 TaxID=3015992 RepID=UPI0024450C7A|nr:hypothetical protein [Aureimonas sp. SK2]
MSLCLSANASPEFEAAAPVRAGVFERVLRLLSTPLAPAEGDLMPAPTRADVLRMAPAKASIRRTSPPQDEINTLLL